MLSDHELEALREIERRLRWTSPELIRLFDGMDLPSEENRRKRAPVRVLVASAALAGLMLRGPRMLNEAEASAQQRPPLPRTPPLETIVARRTASEPAASVAAPVAVADLSIGVSTPRATATCQARARDTVVPLTGEHPTTGRLADRRAVSIGFSCPQSPSSADVDVRAESESSC